MERAAIFYLAAMVPTVASLDNGVGLLPSMGYATWNDVGVNVNETQFLASCDALVSTGLAALGFTYCNLDEGWPSASREEPGGRIVPNPDLFPNGMLAIADHLHDRGLNFGLYTDRGDLTCAGLLSFLFSFHSLLFVCSCLVVCLFLIGHIPVFLLSKLSKQLSINRASRIPGLRKAGRCAVC